MSVKRNVTVPPGSAAIRPSLRTVRVARPSERRRTRPAPLEGAHPRLCRDLRRGARHRDRERRAAVDRQRSRLRSQEPPVGDHRLHAHVWRLPAPRRSCRRPPRAPHDLHGRPRALHRRVSRLRPLHLVGNADRRPRGAGPRRGGRDAGRALDRLDDVHRGRGAEQGTRRLGRGRRQRRGGGRALRRHPHEVPRLGVDLLGQRPSRRRRARADADLRAREPPRGRRARVRPAGGDSRHGRARQPRLRHLAGA